MVIDSGLSGARRFASLALMLGSVGFAAADAGLAPHVASVTAITEVFGDGQKVSAVAVEYDSVIDTAKLKAADFSVEGHAVTKVYANASVAKATEGVDGKFVIVELATPMDVTVWGGPPAGGQAVGANGQRLDQGANHMPQLTDVATDSTASKPLTVSIAQIGAIATADGKVYAGSSIPMANGKNDDLIVQDFKQSVYKDPNFGGKSLEYNLYIPENYDPSKKYPLVLFIHDAGVISNSPAKTLTQGLGAVVWASPADQAKHEAFVLAPQYSSVMANDDSQTSEYMDITVDLIKDLENQYSIDAQRLYNTGQSMGGMTSIAMDIKYPDMFAASLLVACQWDASKVAPMAKKPLWIIVSEGDTKAKPGMDAITATLKGLGSTVHQATWNAEAGASELGANVKSMIAAGTTINYTVFKGGNHGYTWKYAYSIEGVRDWLFAQKK
jgi:predicted peptidase